MSASRRFSIRDRVASVRLVNPERRAASPGVAGGRDVENGGQGRGEVVDVRGGPVARGRVGACREEAGDDAAAVRQRLVADRVDAPVDDEQPAGGDPVLDRLRRQPELQQLPATDHPALPGRDPLNVRRRHGANSRSDVRGAIAPSTSEPPQAP
jgi:hypothetical protein